MSSDAEIELIGNLCKLQGGYAFKSADFQQIGIPVLKIKNIQGSVATLTGSQCYSESEVNERLDKFKTFNGDVLIAMTGAGSVGRVGKLICGIDEYGLLNQRVGRFDVDEKSLNKDFLFYNLTQPAMQEALFMAGSGSGQPNLSPGQIESFKIKVYPLPEQKAIAHVLGKLDDKIELNRQMNQTLEQMAQALFKSWFVDFDPVIDNALIAGNEIPEALKTKAERRKALLDKKKDPKLVEGFPSSFTYSETLDKWIPEGWEVKTIGEIGKVVTGKTPSSKKPEHFGDLCPFVTPTDFKNYFKIITDADRKLSQLGVEKNTNRILPKNCVLVTCIGSDMGKVSINKVECLTNQQINAVVPKSKIISSEYLYYFFKEGYELLRTLAFGGSTMPILNKTDFENISILVPRQEIIESVTKILDSFSEKILRNVLHTQSLSQLRDTLLPRLISGKLRLPEEFVKRFEEEVKA